RNASAVNNGLAYTGRIEYLPFGAFTNGGDYSEGDLEFEQKPKLSIAAAISQNNKATKTGGQLGDLLYETRDITTLIFDAIFKYQGWAASAEYINRDTDFPLTSKAAGDIQYVFKGYGLNTQLSKLVSRKTELAVRYSFVN